MAQGTFRLSQATFTGSNGIYCPQSVLDCWNVPPKPTEDEEGNPLEVLPYTYEDAEAAANLGSAPSFPVVHEEGEAPERTAEGATHQLVPVNNVTIDVFNDCITLAQAEGVPSNHVYLPIDLTRNYLATGELPS